MAKMTITFECENIADLKLQIQEYSLAHLGLDFKAMADQVVASAKPEKKESRILPNPHYPGPHRNIPKEEKRKAGRPAGWRKPKPPAVESTPVSLDSPPVTDPVPEAAGGLSENPFKHRCRKAIHELGRVKGFVIAKSALEKFGAGHLNEVKEEQLEDLTKYCEELTNGQG